MLGISALKFGGAFKEPATSPDKRDPGVLPCLIFDVMAWGGNYAVMKIAGQEHGPWIFNTLRYGLAALLLGAWIVARQDWKALIPAHGEAWRLAIIGLLQVSLTTTLTLIALTMIEASRTVLITYT